VVRLRITADRPTHPAKMPGPDKPGPVNGADHRPARRPTGRRTQQRCRGQTS